MLKIDIRVYNRGTGEGFYRKVLSYVQADKDFYEKTFSEILGEGIEIYTVPNIAKFIEMEFVDIEKIRIYARQLLRGELPYIRALALFDKIVVEEHETIKLSIRHSSLHGLFSTIGELTHSTENHLALTFYRENIVSSLIKISRGQNISKEIKKVEDIYLAILSGLKHYVLYEYLMNIGLSDHISMELKTLQNNLRGDIPIIQKLKYLSTLTALEMNHIHCRIKFNEIEESLMGILEEQMRSIFKHRNLRKRIEALIGATFRVYVFIKKM